MAKPPETQELNGKEFWFREAQPGAARPSEAPPGKDSQALSPVLRCFHPVGLEDHPDVVGNGGLDACGDLASVLGDEGFHAADVRVADGNDRKHDVLPGAVLPSILVTFTVD